MSTALYPSMMLVPICFHEVCLLKYPTRIKVEPQYLRASRFHISTAARASYLGLPWTAFPAHCCGALFARQSRSCDSNLLRDCCIPVRFAQDLPQCSVPLDVLLLVQSAIRLFRMLLFLKFSSHYPRAVAPTLHFFSPTLLALILVAFFDGLCFLVGFSRKVLPTRSCLT